MKEEKCLVHIQKLCPTPACAIFMPNNGVAEKRQKVNSKSPVITGTTFSVQKLQLAPFCIRNVHDSSKAPTLLSLSPFCRTKLSH